MHDHCVKLLIETGYVRTLTGRRRRFPYCYGREPREVWWDGWVAWNAVVQGSSQDVIQIAMRDLHADLLTGRQKGIEIEIAPGEKIALSSDLCTQTRFLLQVHDELMFETVDSAEEVAKIVKWVEFRMSNAVPNQVVKFTAEVGSGPNWVKAKK
jgi:DNA polymerase I-like protein with 3'-5' exonuclease and polymerase domains